VKEHEVRSCARRRPSLVFHPVATPQQVVDEQLIERGPKVRIGAAAEAAPQAAAVVWESGVHVVHDPPTLNSLRARGPEEPVHPRFGYAQRGRPWNLRFFEHVSM